jgi:hypothetical protein
MLSEKQFRERAKTELRQIGDQLVGLATDRDVYWKFEREIVDNNPQLKSTRSAFLDMVRVSYADAMAARILRLLDGDGGASLPEVLTALAQHEQIMRDKISEREFSDDRIALQQAFVKVQRVMVPHTGHHERTQSALTSLHKELDAALDLMIETAKTYYWIVADGYMQLDVRYSGYPLSIFEFAWAKPVLA